jgi:hypothetical protein
MKPISWLRKFAKRDKRDYPLATLIFYGPDDKKASKAGQAHSGLTARLVPPVEQH